MRIARRAGPILGSLGLAVLLWLLVRNLDRSPARFTVPVTYEYPEQSVVLVERVTEVEVHVRATKPKLRTLQAAEFVVKVRNPDGSAGREFVVLDASDVEAPFGVEVERVSPAQFVVRYERRASRRATVQPEVVGKPAPGYSVDTASIRVRPAQVVVAGPASQLDESVVVRTARVDVTGRTQDLKARGVSILPPGNQLVIEGASSAEVDVPIKVVMSRRSFDGVPVEAIAAEDARASLAPRRLRVTVEGPQAQVDAMTTSAIRATLDVTGLAPRAQEYHLEPDIVVDKDACASCRVVGTSQTRVAVTIRAGKGRG